MRLIEKLSLTKIVILVTVSITAVFSYAQSRRTRTFLEHAMNDVEAARVTVSRIHDLQDQYANLLLLSVFNSSAAHLDELNKLERKSEAESRLLAIPFDESVRGSKLVADYISSRRTMRGLQVGVLEALAAKTSPDDLARRFEGWRWAERFNDARLRDLEGYLAASELDAIAQLASLSRFSFATLALLFVMTFLVLAASSAYFWKTLVRPLRALELHANAAVKGNFGPPLVAATRDEVGGLTTSFNVLVEQLERRTEELNQTKESVRASTSLMINELRTPLSTLLSFQKILARPDVAPKRRNELTQLLGEIADRSLKVVDGLLAQAIQESRDFKSRILVSHEELRDVLERLEPEISATGGKVEIGADLPQVRADREQFRELFHNLISNALKYHRPGVTPHVHVTGRTLDVKGKKVHQFDIADNGSGFDDRRQGELFAPYQGSREPGVVSRSGVGLAVCKKIVERHGGTIRARSRRGDGSVFTVQIPEDLPLDSP